MVRGKGSIFNQNLFKGYEWSTGSAVIQPSIRVFDRGFSAVVLGNLDSDQHPSQNFFPGDPEGTASNEANLTLDYRRNIEKLIVTGDHIYRYIASYGGTYFNLKFLPFLALLREITLDSRLFWATFIGVLTV